MDKVIVTILGVGLVGMIYWFFWGKQEEEVAAADRWEIKVSGGYKPKTIKIVADKPAKLIFTRTDNNGCLEEIIFPDYKIKKYLPLNEPVEVVLPSPHPKTSGWHCAMNMFSGKIISQ